MKAEVEWPSADWWTWLDVAEVLDVEEAGGLTSAAVGKKSSAGLEQTSGQGQTSGVEGVGVAEEDLLELDLPGG